MTGHAYGKPLSAIRPYQPALQSQALATSMSHDLSTRHDLVGNGFELPDDLSPFRLPEEQVAFKQPVAVPLKAGYATFHHGKTLHGSGPNRTDRPRRASVTNVVRDGVHSVSDEPLLEGVPVVPSGQALSGQFFPLLLEKGAE